ncbi:MAG: class I SAM-dependent RNA methyltransferase [Acidimicrobiales bacterium]
MTTEVLIPTAMVAGGAALAHDEAGRVVFVDGALPGETVAVQLTEARADYARGHAIEVLEASPDRVEPPCPAVARGCGGCTWQHIAREAQARLKAGIVVDALHRIGHLWGPPEPTVVALSEPALRTTARLSVSPAGRAGYRPRRRTGAVETDSCLAAHPLLEELIVSSRFPGAEEVLLRVGVASGQRRARPRPNLGREKAQLPSDVVLPSDGEPAPVTEVVAGRSFQISLDSFFQPGPVAAEALVNAVAAALEAPGEAASALASGRHELIDAYAGVGLFASVFGARLGIPVTAIESDLSAVADARINLAGMDAKIARVDVGRWRRRRGDAAVGAVIADPPRPGLGRPGVTALVATRTPRLVLVSCDPASLGRDTALLRQAGYNLASVALVDSFPHTFHVETVSRFDRADGT